MLPCPFNYGFTPESVSEDGDPLDVIVLGPRLLQGTRVDVDPVLRVDFVDQGRADPKMVARLDGRPLTLLDRVTLRLFFSAYTLLKRVRSRGRGWTGVRGWTWLFSSAPARPHGRRSPS